MNNKNFNMDAIINVMICILNNSNLQSIFNWSSDLFILMTKKLEISGEIHIILVMKIQVKDQIKLDIWLNITLCSSL